MAFRMKLKFPFLAAILCVFCAAPLFAQKTPEAPKPADYDDADGYAVLSVILTHARSEADPSFLISPFLISPVTVSGSSAESFRTCGSKIPADFTGAATDFAEKNKQNWTVTKKINLKFIYKFANLEGKHTRLAPTQNAKDLPPPLFEQPVYQVSAVGFDASRTHAIAYVAAVCGPDCSSGSYHLLVKDKDGWKETTGSPICQWMSSLAEFLFDRSAS